MKLKIPGVILALSAFAAAPAAFAASDVLFLDDIDAGKKTDPIEVMSWSWGTSNSGTISSGSTGSRRVTLPRDVSSGIATGKRDSASGQASGRSDIFAVSSLDEVHMFSITLDGGSPEAAALCATGKHFPKATLIARGEVFTLENAVVSDCKGSSQMAAPSSHGEMPSRISTNVTVPRQTQGATFGERCNAGICPAPSVTLTLTGKMKHQKTGHVTLMK